MGNVYDGVFRTIVNDCRKLIILVINEVFAEDHTGDQKKGSSPNEHISSTNRTLQKGAVAA